VLVSHETVTELVKYLDLLAVLARQRGATLPAKLWDLHTELAEISTRVTTRVASQKVTAALELGQSELGLVDTATAAGRLNIAEDSVRDLCRRKRLTAMRIDGRWWISDESIRAYQDERGDA
jgi:hypothetical protein